MMVEALCSIVTRGAVQALCHWGAVQASWSGGAVQASYCWGDVRRRASILLLECCASMCRQSAEASGSSGRCTAGHAQVHSGLCAAAQRAMLRCAVCSGPWAMHPSRAGCAVTVGLKSAVEHGVRVLTVR